MSRHRPDGEPGGFTPSTRVEEARQAYKDRYSRAQMILPDRAMHVAAELNRGSSSAYRVLVALSHRYDGGNSTQLRGWFSEGLSLGVRLLRQVLREDPELARLGST